MHPFRRSFPLSLVAFPEMFAPKLLQGCRVVLPTRSSLEFPCLAHHSAKVNFQHLVAVAAYWAEVAGVATKVRDERRLQEECPEPGNTHHRWYKLQMFLRCHAAIRQNLKADLRSPPPSNANGRTHTSSHATRQQHLGNRFQPVVLTQSSWQIATFLPNFQ